jgi:Holliday junction resolvase RusA-like endonuclease
MTTRVRSICSSCSELLAALKAAKEASSMRLEIPRELKSPNRWNGRHWRYKHRESQEWEQAIWVEIAQQAGARTAVQVLHAMNAIPAVRAIREREQVKRRVQVTRLVPSSRNFIRDDDNLRFSVKPLLDALKRLGLIRDDSRKWIELPTPVQGVSTKGGWRTVIEIEPIEAAVGCEVRT